MCWNLLVYNSACSPTSPPITDFLRPAQDINKYSLVERACYLGAIKRKGEKRIWPQNAYGLGALCVSSLHSTVNTSTFQKELISETKSCRNISSFCVSGNNIIERVPKNLGNVNKNTVPDKTVFENEWRGRVKVKSTKRGVSFIHCTR